MAFAQETRSFMQRRCVEWEQGHSSTIVAARQPGRAYPQPEVFHAPAWLTSAQSGAHRALSGMRQRLRIPTE